MLRRSSHKGENGSSILPLATKTNKMSDNQLGATGRFPEGKLNEQDRGELRLAIGTQNGKLVIDFGTYLSWVALSKEEVIGFIEVLQKKLEKL